MNTQSENTNCELISQNITDGAVKFEFYCKSKTFDIVFNYNIFIIANSFLSSIFNCNICGHGFWDKGGVYTGVCRKKKFAAAFGGQNFFSTGV